MSDMSELLNCPFCGATGGKIKAWLHSMPAGEFYAVDCDNGCCRGSYRETEAEAIAAWNCRSNDYIAALEAEIHFRAVVLKSLTERLEKLESKATQSQKLDPPKGFIPYSEQK